jgi:hypothetical protein
VPSVSSGPPRVVADLPVGPSVRQLLADRVELLPRGIASTCPEADMNWYLIRVNDGTANGYSFVGSSGDSLERLAEKAARGEYLRLDDLLYYDQGEVRDWAQWDRRFAPTVFVNPAHVIAIQPFRGDPRRLPK